VVAALGEFWDVPANNCSENARSPVWARPLPVARPCCARTDRLAIASAIWGVAGPIPVLSQLIGLSLGVASLVRLRRARRRGYRLRGRGWAVTGIVSSSLTLLGWIAGLTILSTVARSLAQALDSLP